jgi:FemAB-related protein (PEP-CTERM system-associated)
MVAALPTAAPGVSVRVHPGLKLAAAHPQLAAYANRGDCVPLTRDPGWLDVLAEGLGHTPYALEAIEAGRTVGYLPLALVKSLIFGRFLVSLPYLNSNGVRADHPAAAAALIDRAVGLADELKARHLELRHEEPVEHPALGAKLISKVHMRLPLPDTVAALQKAVGPKVRNQIRKGEKSGLTVEWGRENLVSDFHQVFARNMRDLGTPVYGQDLIFAILRNYPQKAELCVIRQDRHPVACGLLLHGRGVTEVPSASSLREFNATCANMLLYWHLLERAAGRGQQVFDFGRSTVEGNTYKFKKQWGARPEPATWQYYVRTGSAGDVRPDNPKYQRLIRLWQRLPVPVTTWIGPTIARGIP